MSFLNDTSGKYDVWGRPTDGPQGTSAFCPQSLEHSGKYDLWGRPLQIRRLSKEWPHKDGLPLAWICEGTGTIQCLCPYCEYAKGYTQSIVLEFSQEKVVMCHSCGNPFLALVMA